MNKVVWPDPDLSFRHASSYRSESAFVGIDSPISPIMCGDGRAENNYDSIYFVVGTSFK
jgi:NTE family protein